MFKLGLTGGIGSGKSQVAHILAEQGASIVDTDQIAHDLTAPNGSAMPAIRQAFGDAVIAPDESLDRVRMRELAFSDATHRRTLERILHPMIAQAVQSHALAATGLYVVFVVPLLVESGRWRDRLDRICVVDCDPETQIARVQARNGMTRERVQSILDVQAMREERLQAADDVIENTGQTSLDSLRDQVLVLHHRWCNLAGC